MVCRKHVKVKKLNKHVIFKKVINENENINENINQNMNENKNINENINQNENFYVNLNEKVNNILPNVKLSIVKKQVRVLKHIKFNNKPNFKKINYVAWQKSLIFQFDHLMPDFQLRLKETLHHFDHFDLKFNNKHILPFLSHNTHSWFNMNIIPFKRPDEVCQPASVFADTWVNYMKYLDSYKSMPFIECKESQLVKKSEILKTNKRIILPTKTQQRIIFNWFEGHRLMYNETVKFINKNKYFEGPEKGKYIVNSEILRDKYLKKKKQEIIDKLKFEILPKDIDFTEYEIKQKRKDNKNLTKKQIADRKINDKKYEKKKAILKLKNRKITIPVHILDQAINKACAMFKSAITNMERGNIKSFRIRCIKQSKKDKQLHLETNNFYNVGFYVSLLGHMATNEVDNIPDQEDIAGQHEISDQIDIKNENDDHNKSLFSDHNEYVNDQKNNESVSGKKKRNKIRKKNKNRIKNYFRNIEISGDPTLHYDYAKNRFTLLVPETINTSDERKCHQKDKYISLDGGIRTFLTGLSNEMIIEIATNLSKNISDELKKLDKIQSNAKIPKKIKKKYEKRINGRIQRRITDLHWKTIHYLTNNFDHIILGKLSTKSIVKKGSKLNDMTKRVAMCMSFYKFTERLKYKCQRKRMSYQLINEYLTSKLCSKCGEYNDVGDNKKYKCGRCRLYIDRDVNAAKNIAMRGFASKVEVPMFETVEKSKK